MVALMSLAHRLPSAERTGPFSTSEQELARSLWAEIPDDGIILFDRGFRGHMDLLELVGDGRNRHVLMRLRADTSSDEIDERPEGSVLALVHHPADLLESVPDLPAPSKSGWSRIMPHALARRAAARQRGRSMRRTRASGTAPGGRNDVARPRTSPRAEPGRAGRAAARRSPSV